jgi:hypothetical protein
MVLHCYSTSSFVQMSGDGDAESLQDLRHFMPPTDFSVSVMPL